MCISNIIIISVLLLIRWRVCLPCFDIRSLSTRTTRAQSFTLPPPPPAPRVSLPAGSRDAVAPRRAQGSRSGGRAALAARRQYRGRQQGAYMPGRRRGGGRGVCGDEMR